MGDNNTATGTNALNIIQIGSNNTADGSNALGGRYSVVGDANTAIGAGALGQAVDVLGGPISGNTALGSGAGGNLVSSDNNIYVGNPGVETESGTLRIGSAGTQTQTFIAGIFNVNEGGTILPVYINGDGQLGTQPPASSRRFKKAIKRMDNVSEAILALKPVTFCYKNDTKGTSQFGLVAEDVAKVNPDLVARDNNGAIYTVRYEAVNAMLLNEFLKEHRKVKELKANVAQLTSRLKEQDLKIERISNQLEINRPAPHVVANP